MQKNKEKNRKTRTSVRHGQKYTKCKMCLSMMMVMCNKQHLSNISSWINGNIKQHWGWVEKSVQNPRSQ